MDVVKLAKLKKDLIKSIKSLSKSKSSSSTTRSPSFKQYLKKSFTIGTSTSYSNTRSIMSLDDDQEPKKMKNKKKSASQVTPDGCFTVYVGPERRRFVVRTEFANHPLFRMLLEDAESEYGYNTQGPISLPCEVDLFYKVLAEMESCDDHDDQFQDGLFLCSPLRCNKGYKHLSPSRLLKINNHNF